MKYDRIEAAVARWEDSIQTQDTVAILRVKCEERKQENVRLTLKRLQEQIQLASKHHFGRSGEKSRCESAGHLHADGCAACHVLPPESTVVGRRAHVRRNSKMARPICAGREGFSAYARVDKQGNVVVIIIQMNDSRRVGLSVYGSLKSCFDRIASAILLVILSPIFALIAILIKLTSKGPVFYIHRRVGLHGQQFNLIKFRTMRQNADKMISGFSGELAKEWKENYKLINDPRRTKFGALLRKTSIDELPQLINILKGELSFVGPRPVVEEELKKYGNNTQKFLSVTPGLTGYWQAYARNTCTYDKRMEMELYYIAHMNTWFDIKILFKTVSRILSQNGAV